MKIPQFTPFILCSLTLIAFFNLEHTSDFLNKFSSSHNRDLQFADSAGDVTLPTNKFDICSLVSIYFELDSTNKNIIIAIRFDMPDVYFSIGLGGLMKGADIWVFELVNREIIVSDYIGEGDFTPRKDLQNDLIRLGYSITPTYSLIKFKRALNTGDPDDVPIVIGNHQDIIWATGYSSKMGYHGRMRGMARVPFIMEINQAIPSDGPTTSSNTATTAVTTADVTSVHVIVNLIAWGLLADLGILIIKFFRGIKLQIKGTGVLSATVIHAILMTTVVVTSMIVNIKMLSQKAKEGLASLNGNKMLSFHYVFGLIMMSFIVVAFLSGIANILTLRSYARNLKSGLSIKAVHRTLGTIVYLGAKASIITGALLYDDGRLVSFIYIYIFILIGVHISLRIYSFYQNGKPNKAADGGSNKSAMKLSHRQIGLVDAVNHHVSYEDLLEDFADMKWLMLGNGIYDLTKWIHPGGNNVIQACIGREVGRYIYGNHTLEGSGLKPHIHSALTSSQLHSFRIGDLTNYESVLLSPIGKQEIISDDETSWKMVSITTVSSSVSEVRLQSKKFAVKNFGSSLTWLGRHFKIGFANDKYITRLYTTALSLTETNTSLRKNLYTYFNSIMTGADVSCLDAAETILQHSECLSLFMKDYTMFSKGLSHELHQIDLNSSSNLFRLEGPLGRGLGLDNTTTGFHTIICGGTGILAVIDFLNMFMMKNMYELLKEKAGIDKADQFNVYNIPFEDCMNGLKVNFFGFFANEEEILGLDIIVKLAEISSKYGRRNFAAYMRGYSDENMKRIDSRFSDELCRRYVTSDAERYYVVGPPKMNNDVVSALSHVGVPKEKICLV